MKSEGKPSIVCNWLSVEPKQNDKAQGHSTLMGGFFHPARCCGPEHAASNALLRKEIYPDSVSSSDVVLFSYNRLGQILSKPDQNGSTHSYDYDKLGRLTQDRIPTLGSGVDGAVRRIATSFDVRGMTEKVTSYSNASVGSGSVVSEVQFSVFLTA